jgi:hypothetical protein
MKRMTSVKVLAALGMASLLACSVQASTVSIGAPTLVTGGTVDMTNDVATGMATNVDWIHLLSGNVNLHGLTGASATVAADLSKNLTTPYISRNITFTEHANASVNDWPQAGVGGDRHVAYTYSDAASVANPGSTTSEGIFQAGDLTLTINVPDTNPYVLSVYGHDRWTPFVIKSASLSGGPVAGPRGAGGSSTDLYRVDIAYQADAPTTLTVTFGYNINSQGASVGASTLSSVPEPASLSLLGLGLVGLLRRRRA